jgi:16S rRNA processing protein RimM
MPEWDAMIVVGRIARTHGLRGEVVVDLDTDFADERFQPGAVMFVAAAAGPRALTIEAARFHKGRPLVSFAGIASIEAAEALGRGELRMPVEALGTLPPATYYHHDLIGCEVVTEGGASVGRVVRVDGSTRASLLAIAGRAGDILVPLVEGMCVSIDPAARRIVIAPPEGLLELNA